MTDSATTRPRVVVGVDGSEGSTSAVAWAADYASQTGGTLELLIAWPWPSAYGQPIHIPGYEPEADARAAVKKVAAALKLPAEQMRLTVVSGAATQQLVEASTRADLLVVGSRGHGGFSELLLGSVSGHCVHHAHCPVVVVRPADAGPAPST